jgi:hypothetical protein
MELGVALQRPCDELCLPTNPIRNHQYLARESTPGSIAVWVALRIEPCVPFINIDCLWYLLTRWRRFFAGPAVPARTCIHAVIRRKKSLSFSLGAVKLETSKVFMSASERRNGTP